MRYDTPVDEPEGAARLEGVRRGVRRQRRAARARSWTSPAATSTDQIHIGIEWLESIALRPHRHGRQARADHRRRQHGDGLLPLGQAPRRHRRQGDGAQARASTSRRRRGSSRTPRRSRSRSSRTMSPVRFVVENGKLTGMEFEQLHVARRERQAHAGTGRPRSSCRATRDPGHRPGERVPLDRARHRASSSTSGTCRSSTRRRSSRRAPGVFFGGDAAFGPENIIWAVEHGHQAAISIHNHCQGVPVTERPPHGHERSPARRWGCTSGATATTTTRSRAQKMKHVDLPRALLEA